MAPKPKYISYVLYTQSSVTIVLIDKRVIVRAKTEVKHLGHNKSSDGQNLLKSGWERFYSSQMVDCVTEMWFQDGLNQNALSTKKLC